MKKSYAKPTVSRFSIRPEDAVVAACIMAGGVWQAECQPGAPLETAEGS